MHPLRGRLRVPQPACQEKGTREGERLAVRTRGLTLGRQRSEELVVASRPAQTRAVVLAFVLSAEGLPVRRRAINQSKRQKGTAVRSTTGQQVEAKTRAKDKLCITLVFCWNEA